MQKIIPHLWFDKEAKAAAEFYADTFGGNSKINSVSTLHDTPSGDADTVSFTLLGQDFMAISAGPLFKLNPSISFVVACQTQDEVEALWSQLFDGGTALMPLDAYPFSEKYGWLQDKYGVSWQLMYVGDQPVTTRITPTLLFVGDVCGQAEAAANFYVSVFKNAQLGDIMRYSAGQEPEKEGTVMHLDFTLEGQKFAAMDSARAHKFSFNEAISLMVSCDNQAEIDYYWDKLTAVPEAEQCGWLKDKYGVSWQITPRAMDQMMQDPDEQRRARVAKAFLTMKKFDLAELNRVYEERDEAVNQRNS